MIHTGEEEASATCTSAVEHAEEGEPVAMAEVASDSETAIPTTQSACAWASYAWQSSNQKVWQGGGGQDDDDESVEDEWEGLISEVMGDMDPLTLNSIQQRAKVAGSIDSEGNGDTTTTPSIGVFKRSASFVSASLDVLPPLERTLTMHDLPFHDRMQIERANSALLAPAESGERQYPQKHATHANLLQRILFFFKRVVTKMLLSTALRDKDPKRQNCVSILITPVKKLEVCVEYIQLG